MGEEVRMTGFEASGADDDDRVLDWKVGLPCVDDLTPLSQPLIPPELAHAFSISPEPFRTLLDVNRASQSTISNICGGSFLAFSSSNFKPFNESPGQDPMVVVEGEDETDRDGSGSDSRKLKNSDCAEEANTALRTENSTEDPSARTLKRPRLVWTPQLHKRFVEVVGHLGIKNAVPKTIMQLMNVEGLTRENVSSHLQKYRLYLKRMQGLSNEGASLSDKLFASAPVPQSLRDSGRVGNGHMLVPVPMHYAPTIMPVPVFGMANGHGQMGIPVGNPNGTAGYPWYGTNLYTHAAQNSK